MKIVIIDDSAIAAEAPDALAKIGHEVFGIQMDGTNTIFSLKGEEKMSIREALTGADVIFLDHNMPTPGDELLKQLLSMGLITEETRIIGISSGNQEYLKEHIPWTFLLYKPEAIKRLIEI